MAAQNHHVSSKTLWIFGYGSLIWNPGFEFRSCKIGFIRGYSRRFWQGNTAHRGTPEQPGRVATLIEDPEGITWGRAFQLVDENSVKALDYLFTRESKLGGYITQIVVFQSKNKSSEESQIPVMVYTATPDNPHYIGPGPLDQVADQVVCSEGPCGPNAEYVLKLTDFMRNHLPEVDDEHLYSLDSLVRKRLRAKNVCAESLLTKGNFAQIEDDESDEEVNANPMQNSFQFAASLPKKNLRCLKV